MDVPSPFLTLPAQTHHWLLASPLDRTCIVFGEVFRGMEVVDKIVAAARDEFDNPLKPITMTMTVKE